jgi:hypothetical protein
VHALLKAKTKLDNRPRGTAGTVNGSSPSRARIAAQSVSRLMSKKELGVGLAAQARLIAASNYGLRICAILLQAKWMRG